MKAKLTGFVQDPDVTLREYPESDRSIPATYARAYAWHRAAYPEKADAEAARLVSTAPHDPYFLELQGQILLESGKPKEALPALREAEIRSNHQPLISALLGHALIATEDPANFNEARKVLRLAVQRDNQNPDAWYQLGIIYDREGDHARASLATAERYNLLDQPQLAPCSGSGGGQPTAAGFARLAARTGYCNGFEIRARRAQGQEKVKENGALRAKLPLLIAAIGGIIVGGGAITLLKGHGGDDRSRTELVVRDYILGHPRSSPKP